MVRFRRTPVPLSFGGRRIGLPREDPPLVQVGNSPIFVSPSEPASPFDCARWPDSPYCGGNPWASTPLGIEVQVVADECNLGISLVHIVGWTVTPNIDLVYRKPSCRDKKPPGKKTLDEVPPTPYPDLPDDYFGLFIIAYKETSHGYVSGDHLKLPKTCESGQSDALTYTTVNSWSIEKKGYFDYDVHLDLTAKSEHRTDQCYRYFQGYGSGSLFGERIVNRSQTIRVQYKYHSRPFIFLGSIADSRLFSRHGAMVSVVLGYFRDIKKRFYNSRGYTHDLQTDTRTWISWNQLELTFINYPIPPTAPLHRKNLVHRKGITE